MKYTPKPTIKKVKKSTVIISAGDELLLVDSIYSMNVSC